MIAVMGATGHTGGQIAAALLERGVPVRALGRSSRRLEGLAAAGAQVRIGDAADAAFLTDAFRGAAAVYTLMPYDPQAADFDSAQDRLGEAIAGAVRDSGVRHVVALSSVGAELAEGNGPIASLHRQEQRLQAIDGVNLLSLRAGAFFENFDGSLKTIREQGVLADAYAPEVAVPMVATCDIAQVAVQALQRRDWQGTIVQEVLGPDGVSHADAARLIGERLGMPTLRYVQMPYQVWAEVLMEAGLSRSVATALTGLAQSINEGRVKAAARPGSAGIGRTRLQDHVAGWSV